MLNPKDIEFPVYPLRKYDSIVQGSRGAVFVKDLTGDIYLIDDKSKEGTFGARRLRIKGQLTKSDTIKLYKLNRSFNTWSELLTNVRKVHSKTYIDNTGFIFKYFPTVRVPLKYFRIVKVQSLEGMHSYLLLDGLQQKIQVSRPPPKGATWAGILMAPTGYLLYSYSEGKLPDTNRKV